jgi:hypothetical protein
MLCVLRAHAFGFRKRGSGCDNVVASWRMLRASLVSALCSYMAARDIANNDNHGLSFRGGDDH